MKFKKSVLAAATVIASLGVGLSAKADTTTARCDVYPKGSDQVSSYGPCNFSQRQGYVTIVLEDGTTYELTPSSTQAASYTDQNGRPATSEDGGLGDAGIIYRLADVSIFVYWDGAATSASSSTVGEPRRGSGSVPCSYGRPSYDVMCQADVIFGDSGNSSLALIGVRGDEHHLAFYGNSLYSIDPDDEVSVQFLDGQYLININDEEFFKLDEIMVTGAD